MMIYFYLVVGALLIGISEVLRYYYEPNALNPVVRKRINRAWHIYRDLGMICYIVVGYLLPNYNLLYNLPLFWAIHWILTDGIQNILKGKDFFYTSPTSGNYIEMLGKWYVKLSLLLAGFTLKTYMEQK